MQDNGLLKTLGLELTYDNVQAVYLVGTDREEFYHEEIEDWMRDLPDFYESELDDPIQDYPTGEETEVNLPVLDEEVVEEILGMLAAGQIKRSDAVANIAQAEGIPEEEVNKILKEHDL